MPPLRESFKQLISVHSDIKILGVPRSMAAKDYPHLKKGPPLKRPKKEPLNPFISTLCYFNNNVDTSKK